MSIWRGATYLLLLLASTAVDASLGRRGATAGGQRRRESRNLRRTMSTGCSMGMMGMMGMMGSGADPGTGDDGCTDEEDGGDDDDGSGGPNGGGCDPRLGSLVFNSIDQVLSVEKGKITASWFPAELVATTDEIFECDEEIIYNIFFAPQGFDFKGFTIEELAELASQENSSVIYFSTSELEAVIDNFPPSETYDGLILASSTSGGGTNLVSGNSDGTSFAVSVASEDPVLKPGTRVIGPLDASDVLTVNVTPPPLEGEPLTITFVATEDGLPSLIENMLPGDHATGVASSDELYLVRLETLLSSDATSSTWMAQPASLSDIFEVLDLAGSINVAEDFGRSAGVVERNLGRRSGSVARSLQAAEFVTTSWSPKGFNLAVEKQFLEDTVTIKASQTASVRLDFTIQLGEIFFFDEVPIGGSIVMHGSITNVVSIEFEDAATESQEEQLEIWRGKKVRRPFVVFGVPVYLEIEPFAEAFVAASVSAELKGSVEATKVSSVSMGASYFDDSWSLIDKNTNPNPSIPRVNGFSTDNNVVASASGSIGLTAEGGFAFKVEASIYTLFFVTPGIEAGAKFELQYLSTPTLQDPPFYLKKYDLSLFVRFPLTVGVDLPFRDRDEENFNLGSADFPLIELPTISLKETTTRSCMTPGEASVLGPATLDALYLEARLNFTDSSRLFSNPPKSPSKFIVDEVLAADPRFSVVQRDGPVLTLSLPRSQIVKGSKNIEIPDVPMFVRSTPTIPRFGFNLFSFMLFGEKSLADVFPGIEGFECCDSEDCDDGEACVDGLCMGSAAPTAAEPTQAPVTPVPPITMAPPSTCRSICCDRSCDKSGVNGDPHLVTFDNLRYSCQAGGEFMLINAFPSGVQVQGRFEKKNSLVSLATGVAATGGNGTTTVQISIPKERPGFIELIINGTVMPYPTAEYEDEHVRVFESSGLYTIVYKKAEVEVIARYVNIISFKHLALSVNVAQKFRNEVVLGLLGSPDDDPLNDWTDSAGTVLEIPSGGNLGGEPGYTYCSTQWCIRNSADSMFVYEEGFEFDSFFGCDAPFPGGVNTNGASDELRALCGTDQACLIDGIELGIDGAQSLLEGEAAVSGTSGLATFGVAPNSTLVNSAVNVVLTVNLTDSPANETSSIDAFFVYRLNSETLQIGSAPVVTLRDIGLGVGDDNIAGDLVFSNVLAAQSLTAGETFSFRAVPVISGAPVPTSRFVYSAFNAVRVFSAESGIADGNVTLGPPDVIVENSIDGLVLVIEYSWPADQLDLDTGTSFLGLQVGYSCGSSGSYIQWSGDDTSTGGTERVKVLLGTSFADSLWSSEYGVAVTMNAGWFGGFNRGPASLTVYTEKVDSNEQIVAGNAVSSVIAPGAQSGCAGTNVGVASISVAEDGKVNIAVSRGPT